jgi:hypothetical protein
MKITHNTGGDDAAINNTENRRYTEFDFVTEDTDTGDVTVSVILDRACAVLLAVIISLGVIVLAHAALSLITGEWL